MANEKSGLITDQEARVGLSDLLRIETPCCNRRVRGVVLIHKTEKHIRQCPKCKVKYEVEIRELTDTTVQLDWLIIKEREDDNGD